MISYRFLFAVFLLIILVALNPVLAYDNVNIDENENSNEISARYRLPKEIIPVSYDLSIYTHPSDADYDGHVRIILQVLKKTDFIVLHTDALIVQSNASLTDKSGQLILISHYVYDQETQMLTIKFERALEPARYTIELSFKGYIANDVFGFYASLYEVEGKLRRIGVTQFSPTYARRAFPCMDEPYLKAEFQVRIGHHKDQNATSNTPVESIRMKNDTYYVTTFHRTPRISTYLVGWTVHNFVSERSRISENFKIWTRDSMKFRGSMALNHGQAVFSALQTWLSVKSPLEKVDQFAIPDFNFGAMENWGLVTYRESVVLHENGITPTRIVLNGLQTMAHEYAHTWFGNLVTPKFWDVVWLKEGFATYFQYFGVFIAKPDFLRMMNMFAVHCLQPTLLVDSDNHTRTMNGREVDSRSSIMATLDFVSYEKGACVIRMTNHIIGSTAFQLGLQNYLREMSYQAALPSDLYRHLQTASDNSGQLPKHLLVKDIIESWANQPGYPLVTITRNYTTKALFASQERFYLSRHTTQTDKSGWWIPLTFVIEESNSTFDRINIAAWLEPQVKSAIIGSFEPNSWVIFNVQQIGYYRVNYDENNWKMLIDYLRLKNFKKIHAINRAALLDDAFNLARAGYVNYSIPFDIATYLIHETEYEPWVAAVHNFNFLNHILASSPRVQQLFQVYTNRILKSIYSLLSFIENPADSLTIKLHRELILSAACSINNIHCLKKSKILFDSWISMSEKRVSANLKSFVYCAGIRVGDDNDWHTVWNRFLRTDLHIEQELLLNALGCTKNPQLIDKYLNMSITYEFNLRKQYRMMIINAVLNGNPENVNYVIDFIFNNLHAVLKLRGIDFLNKMLTAIGNKIITEVQLNKFRFFVDENIKDLGSALNSARKTIAVSEASITWINEFLPAIEKALLFN